VLVLDAVGAAASQLRRTSSMRPSTPTLLDGWGDAAQPRTSCTSMTCSSSSAASRPGSLAQEGGSVLQEEETDVEALRCALAQLQARLRESDDAASSLAAELGTRDEGYSAHLAQVQSCHAQEMHALEHALRAEVRSAKAPTPGLP
jgi:hypothetical protein